MKYNKTIILKNGKECYLRNGIESDGQTVFENFNLTHMQTDYLPSYPDENSFDVTQESRFLKEKSESENETEIIAMIDNVINEVHSKGAKFWKLCLCGFLRLCGTGKTTNEQYWVCKNCGNKFKV